MNYTETHSPPLTELRDEPRTDYAPTTQEAPYSTQWLADRYNVKPQTISSWISRYIKKVAPEESLKVSKGFYTSFALTLLDDFADTHEKERGAWVAKAKEKYSSEFDLIGVVECEIVPDDACSTLAIMNSANTAIQQQFSDMNADMEGFIDGLNGVEANISEAELKSWVAQGQLKGAMKFQAVETAAAQTFHGLQKKRMGGQQSS